MSAIAQDLDPNSFMIMVLSPSVQSKTAFVVDCLAAQSCLCS